MPPAIERDEAVPSGSGIVADESASAPRARGWIVPGERNSKRGNALGIDIGDLGAIEQVGKPLAKGAFHGGMIQSAA